MHCMIGMANRDLEPALRPLPVTVSEERICAVALYAASKDVRAVWIELDFMDFNFKVVSTLQKAVAEKTGMEIEHVHILTTHNHSGGEPDLQTLAELVASCAEEAVKTAKPAQIRKAITTIPRQVSFIRRIYVPEIDGATSMFYGVSDRDGFDSSPHTEHMIQSLKKGILTYRDVTETDRPYRPYEPGDPCVAAIEFRGEDGAPIGTVVRFASHVNCNNYGSIFASDFPHYMRKKLEETVGGTAMFITGPCGNICPSMTKKNDGSAAMIGTLLADTAMEVLQKTEFAPLETVEDRSVPISLPVRQEVMTRQVTIPEVMPEALPDRRRYLEKVDTQISMEFLWEKYQEGETERKDTVDITIGMLKLNDLLLVGFPGETFYETGEAVRRAFPREEIITATEHDRTVMYMPPRDQLWQGGYETVCRVTDEGAAEKLEAETIAAVKRFLDKE